MSVSWIASINIEALDLVYLNEMTPVVVNFYVVVIDDAQKRTSCLELMLLE